MFAHLKQKGVCINTSRGHSHFKARQRLLIETPSVQFCSLLQCRMNWCGNVFKSDGFHRATIAQPLRLSITGFYANIVIAVTHSKAQRLVFRQSIHVFSRIHALQMTPFIQIHTVAMRQTTIHRCRKRARTHSNPSKSRKRVNVHVIHSLCLSSIARRSPYQGGPLLP